VTRALRRRWADLPLARKSLFVMALPLAALLLTALLSLQGIQQTRSLMPEATPGLHSLAALYRVTLFAALAGVMGGLLGMALFASGVTRRILRLSVSAKRLSRGIQSTALEPSRDEIGQLGDTLQVAGKLLLSREGELRQVNEALRQKFEELTERHQHLVVLSQLTAALQQSPAPKAALENLRERVAALAPQASGALYLEDGGRYRAAWRLGPDVPETLSACLALPSGQHYSEARDPEARYCAHLAPPYPVASICLSLAHQGRPLGLLHLRLPHPLSETTRQILEAMSDRTALALVNLQLQGFLREQAVRDPLTGLYNRRYLEETLHRALERSKRSGEPVSVLAADLDHFKRVNDRYGHALGDRALQAFAALLAKGFRAQDVPCRSGGEEFIVVLPGTPPQDAALRAQRLVEQVRDLRVVTDGGQRVPLTVSVGTAGYPQDAEDAERLIACADAALYRAKAGGRDRAEAAAPAPHYSLSDPRD
jgi:diguanylate cyclase (GGDEF)-like protein